MTTNKMHVSEVLTAEVQAQLSGAALRAALEKIVAVQPSGTWVSEVQNAKTVRDNLPALELETSLEQHNAIRGVQGAKKRVEDTHQDMTESHIAASWANKSKPNPENEGFKR